jgi:hypothetical protein
LRRKNQELSIESKEEIGEHCESKLSFKLSSIQFFLLLNKEESDKRDRSH